MMSTSREAFRKKLSRHYERMIAGKFDLWPEEAIPPAYRPPTGQLSHALLSKLAELAMGVHSLDEFRDRLILARDHRPSGRRTPLEDQALRSEDVEVALKKLAAEFASEGPKVVQAVKAQDGIFEKPVSPSNEPSSALRRTHGMADTRTRPAHFSKLGPMKEVLTGTGDIKPLVKRAHTEDHTESAMASSTGTTPIQENYDATVPLRDPFAHSVPGTKVSESQIANPNLSCRRSSRQSKRRKVTAGRHDSMSGEDSPTTSRPRRSSRKSSSVDATGDRVDIVSGQQEHSTFFDMPPNQHYKKKNPQILKDPTAILDYHSLEYPVEVETKKGEHREINNAAELEQFMRQRYPKAWAANMGESIRKLLHDVHKTMTVLSEDLQAVTAATVKFESADLDNNEETQAVRNEIQKLKAKCVLGIDQKITTFEKDVLKRLEKKGIKSVGTPASNPAEES